MKEKKNIERILKGAENFIVASENGCGIQGGFSEVMTLYTLITKKLAEELDKEMLEQAFEIAFKTEEELLDMTKEVLEKLKEKLEKKED